ncbi:MAG: hypothetical protein WC421_07665 [Elusimicrobiales bacterium]
MNLQQAICLRIGNPKQWRNPRGLLLYLVICALTAALLLLLDENA